MQKKILFTALSVCALLLSGCGGASLDALSAEGETWLLVDGEVDGKPLNIDGQTVTLSFVDGEAIVGNGAVNNYRAPVEIEAGSIKHTGPLITTLMAGPMPAMRLESAYLGALDEAKTVERQADRLTIKGDGDVLHYTLQVQGE